MEKPSITTKDVMAKILAGIAKFEREKLSAWREIDAVLRLDFDGTFHDLDLESDLTALPGWQMITKDEQSRIIEAVLMYFKCAPFTLEEWWKTDSYPASIFPDYRALRFAVQRSIDSGEKYVPYIWEHWAPFVLSYPVFGNQEQESVHQKIIAHFYKLIPDEMVKAAMEIIDYENARGHILVLDKMDQCWDRKLELAVMDKTADPALRPDCRQTILNCLQRHKIL